MEIRDRIVELRRVRASKLIPNKKNWRTHPKKQQRAMSDMLVDIGYADALIARETPAGLELLDGHLRRESTPNDEVPVLIVDLDDSEAERFLATFDPLAEMAGADKDLLKGLLEEISTDSVAVNDMLEQLAIDNGVGPEVEEAEDGPDPCTERIDELKEQWKPCLGQVWDIMSGDGERVHRLRCGDSTAAIDVKDLLQGAVPFIMVTDPPYGVEYDPEWRKEAGINDSERMGKVSNDERFDWTAAYELFPGPVAYVWHGGKHAGSVADNLHDAGFEIRTQIIWNKPSLIISRGHYHWKHEPCWYAVRDGETAKWCGNRKQSTIWNIEAKEDLTGETVHSTQKPAECMARPIRNHGAPGDIVYDPFLGSGTTILAADQCDRICYGMELDPGYIAVILERCREFGLYPSLASESE